MKDEHLHGGGDIAHTFVNITTAKKAIMSDKKMCVRRRHYVPDIDKKKKKSVSGVLSSDTGELVKTIKNRSRDGSRRWQLLYDLIYQRPDPPASTQLQT
jgi:hypothetical protein